MIVDGFSGHSYNDVKEFVRSFKNGSDDDKEDNVNNLFLVSDNGRWNHVSD